MQTEAEVTIALISFGSAIIGLAAAIAGRKKVIEIRHVVDDSRSTTPMTSNRSEPWYDKTLWLIFWTIAFWPIGIYGILRSSKVTLGWKAGVAVFVLIMIGAALKH